MAGTDNGGTVMRQTLVWIMATFLGGVLGQGIPPSVGLIRHLVDQDRYDPRALPADPETGRVTVHISITVNRLNALDDRNQWLTWSGYVNATWRNPYLTWNPDKWNGTRIVMLKEKEMWVPDISILQRLNGEISFGEQKRRLIQVTYDGYVFWYLGGNIITTACKINVRKFPFDRQTCNMFIGSYTVSTNEIELVDTNDSRVDNLLGENGLWEAVSSESSIVVFQYENRQGVDNYTYLSFTMNLRRKSAYFILNIIIPVLVMAVLMCMVFFLPADGGEKIGFSITLLLAFNVIQLVIVDWMPQTSDSLPIIAFYVTALLCMSALCIPASVFVIYIHNTGPARMPLFIQKFLYSKCRLKNQQVLLPTDVYLNQRESQSNDNNHVDNADIGSDFGKGILFELRTKRARHEERERKRQERETWREAADVLDRLFLRAMTSFLVVITVIFAILVMI